MTKILLSCGEPSGDLYAGALTTEILKSEPQAEVAGLGGERFEAAGGRLVASYRGLAVTGLLEAVRVLPRSWRVYRQLVAEARARRPDVFVAIDFPDFNFRVARRLRALGVPVIYYIPPQLWAWRAGRLEAIRRFATRVLVIFPFEEALYRETGIPVDFVGHPLLGLSQTSAPRDAIRAELGLDADDRVLALLPGSRSNEVARLMPVLGVAAAQVAERVRHLRVLVARAPHLADDLFEHVPEVAGHRPVVIEGRTDDVIAAADVVATASGTATVQTAIHGVPMVVVYKLSPWTYRLGRRFVRVSTYAMANLIAGRRIVPELIQDACTPEAVADEIVRYLEDASYADATRASLHAVRASLGGDGASGRAASAILAAAASAPGSDASDTLHE